MSNTAYIDTFIHVYEGRKEGRGSLEVAPSRGSREWGTLEWIPCRGPVEQGPCWGSPGLVPWRGPLEGFPLKQFPSGCPIEGTPGGGTLEWVRWKGSRGVGFL